MGPVAAAGYHVFAPDVRGYGRTSGADTVKYSDDLRPFGTLNRIRDMVALVAALGYRTVNVVGHDQGSPLAGWCACARPDIFRTAVDVERSVRRAAGAPDHTRRMTRRGRR